MLNPMGIVFIVMAVIAVFVFIWNLRREELSPDELVKKRDRRLPDLELLKEKMSEYIEQTYLISKDGSLYDTKPSVITLIKTLENNYSYLELKVDRVGHIVDTLISISQRLDNNRMGKLIHQVIKDEHKARSQQIAIRLYRNTRHHLGFNESKLIKTESQIERANYMRIFAKTLKSFYSHIEMMERGGDLWSVNTASHKTPSNTAN